MPVGGERLHRAERGGAVGLALEPDVEPRGEAVPRDAHGDVAGDHHQPDHRQRDLEGRDEVDEVVERRLVDGVDRVADPGRDRVVGAPDLLVELPLGRADEEDRRALEQRQRLDEVGLPEGRAEEAAAPALGARVVLLPVDDQVDDADRAEQADELAEPLVGVPVADERPGEVGLEELEVRRQHGGAEEQERRVDEPVHDADPVPLQHPGVEERLLEHRRRVRPVGLSLRPGAGWPLRMTPSMRRTAGTSRATAATVSANERTIAKICMKGCSSVGAYRAAA